MAEIIEQGEIDIAGTVLYTGTFSSGSNSKIIQLKFYNSLAYVLTLEKYDAATATSKVLYSLTLNAGDSITDSAIYALKEGDKLIAYSDIPGTSYYTYGFDYASS
jgi:hypothetical protein